VTCPPGRIPALHVVDQQNQTFSRTARPISRQSWLSVPLNVNQLPLNEASTRQRSETRLGLLPGPMVRLWSSYFQILSNLLASFHGAIVRLVENSVACHRCASGIVPRWFIGVGSKRFSGFRFCPHRCKHDRKCSRLVGSGELATRWHRYSHFEDSQRFPMDCCFSYRSNLVIAKRGCGPFSLHTCPTMILAATETTQINHYSDDQNHQIDPSYRQSTVRHPSICQCG
jgi:hypothetical protein